MIRARINTAVKLETEKVVDFCPLKDIEDSDKENIAFCRCWKSKTASPNCALSDDCEL